MARTRKSEKSVPVLIEKKVSKVILFILLKKIDKKKRRNIKKISY